MQGKGRFWTEEDTRRMAEMNDRLTSQFMARFESIARAIESRGGEIRHASWPHDVRFIDGNDLRFLADALVHGLNGIGSHSGYIAFIDLLGFSRRVALAAPEEFFLKYEEAMSRAFDPTAGGPFLNVPRRYQDLQDVSYVVSSDNIVLYTTSSDEKGLVAIVEAVARLFYELSIIEVPVRGAIASGSFRETRTPRGTIIAGPPILDAVEYEKRQDWVGIMLTPSLVQRHAYVSKDGNLRPDVRDPSTGSHLIRQCNIPYKAEGGRRDYDGFAVLPNPAPGSKLATATAISDTIAAMKAMYRFAPDPASQDKYANIIRFLENVHETL